MSQDRAEARSQVPQAQTQARAQAQAPTADAWRPCPIRKNAGRSRPGARSCSWRWRRSLSLTAEFPGAGATTKSSSNGRWSRPFQRSRWSRRTREAKPANSCCRAMSTPSHRLHSWPGERLRQEWRKDIGAKVHQGDVLAVVDTPELDERIAVAQSEAREGQGEYGAGESDGRPLEFAARLGGGVSAGRRRKGQRCARKAAQVDAAQSNVDRLKALKAFANIVAPFDGVVTARNVDVGSLVKADSNDGAAAVHSRRHSSDADLCSRAGILCGRDEGRDESDARTARVSRPHVRRDHHHDLARDRQEIAHAAGRTPRRQQGRPSRSGRVHARPFSDPA